MRSDRREVAAFFGALCLFFATVEYLFPRPVPFLRLGLSNLPILLAGRGGGAVQPGQHLRFSGSPPVGNLFLTVLRAFGIQDATFGDDGTAPLTLL